MVFTQGRGFVFGASFGLRNCSLRCRVLVCRAADTASLATRVLFGKLLGVAMLVGFGEKRCLKTFRCVPRSLDESHLFTRRNRNLDTPRTCSVRRCLRTISSGARRFHQCRPDTAVPIDDSHLCNDCRVAASRLDWLDAHAHRRPHGRRYCFCVHRSWC